MLQLDLQQIVSQALSFLLLLWVLKRLAWRPLLGILDERRARIEQGLRQITEGKVELLRLQQDYSQRLARIDSEARAKIQEAVLEGQRIASEIQEQARAQASAILAQSKEGVELELAKARVTLRDQVAEMTIEAVGRILRQKLDDQADGRLVEAVLAQLEQEPS